MSTLFKEPRQLDISNKAMNLKGKLYFPSQIEETLGPTIKSAATHTSALNVVHIDRVNGGLSRVTFWASCLEAPKKRKYSLTQLLGDALGCIVPKVARDTSTSNKVQVQGFHGEMSRTKSMDFGSNALKKRKFSFGRVVRTG